MWKKIILIIIILVIFIVSVYGILSKDRKVEGDRNMKNELNAGEDISVVPTMRDIISRNASWCGTFQLVWNDMKNEVVKRDIVFDPQVEIAENLNKEEFNETMISEEYYYKTYGFKTIELKERIEKEILEKFNQKSDILDQFNWDKEALSNANNRYFFYTMLYRNFEFQTEFTDLGKDKFGNQNQEANYFGIDETSNGKIKNQITVLYYNSQEDFAILINTKSNDEVIFCKNPEGNNFSLIYENMIKKEKAFKGETSLTNIDLFKAPKIDLDVLKEYEEIENKEFSMEDGMIARIEKAMQSIKLTLDEKGGTIKSEAAIDMIVKSAARIEKIDEPRYFYVDDTFALFLREKGKEMPYFASRIEDITKFQ